MDYWVKKPFWILLIIFMSHQGFSQFQNEKSIQFFNHLYNFEFIKADSIISTIDSAEQSSKYNFLKSHYLRWYYLPIHQQNEEVFSKYAHYLDVTTELSIVDDKDYISINRALLIAEYNYNQGNYYKAFQNGSLIYDLLKKNLEIEPERAELKFLASLYHYYYQYYKEVNPAIGAMIWFFKEGEKEIGLKWLEEVANQKSIVRTEALIYLSHIYLRLENNPEKAYQYAEKLHQLYPNNLKFYELLIECSLANNINNDLLDELIHRLSNSNTIYFTKYGVCYNAVYLAKYGRERHIEKIDHLENALTYIHNNGGGNHLSSLLYQNIYLLTGDSEFLKKKNKVESYKYELTGYPEDYNN